MQEYTPSMLPPVASVEVVLLDRVEPPGVGDFLRAATAAPRATVDGATAERIARLWRQLPPGEQARCHIPPFGLRFRAAGAVVCEGSICWKCNNIYGEASGEPFCYEFDAQADESQALLAELRRIAPGPGGG